MNTPTKTGTVYLVGAGPGNPELITVRGLRLLKRANVVAYDRLVHPDLVAKASPSARRFYVGKTPGGARSAQEDINALLIDAARRGGVVVRLKGGDPFVFGRGSEEALALREADVPFEVVPGVTSAISAPAYAGVPVTHRGLSSTFTVVTGHTCRRSSADPDWAALARAGTLVVLMGLKRLPLIAATLIEQGRAPTTPVAVIQAGSTSAQEVVRGALTNIGERTRHLHPPATVVIGDVARLGHALSWFAAEPGDAPVFSSTPHPVPVSQAQAASPSSHAPAH